MAIVKIEQISLHGCSFAIHGNNRM